jgi:hypothetical protein
MARLSAKAFLGFFIHKHTRSMAMGLHNTTLNEEFVLEDNAKFIAYLSTADNEANVIDILNQKAWGQLVARIAFGGIPEQLPDALAKLEALEVDVRNHYALPSARPGGARSKGTGFKLHPTYKSYVSTIKGAIDNSVELLDAVGMPRSRGDVSDDIKAAKHVEKTPEEKLTQATATWLTIYADCNAADPAVLALVKQITDATTTV